MIPRLYWRRFSSLGGRFDSFRINNDPEIVLAAVQQDVGALEYASDALKNDPEILMAAVQQDELGDSIRFG